MRFEILTLFPEMFPGPLGHSLPGKAMRDGLFNLELIDIRRFATDKHRTVDDTPYGGGAGMIMRADVIDAALTGAEEKFGPPARKIYLSPRGKPLTQKLIKEFAKCSSLSILCGRYEGIDERAIEAHSLEEISLGDFVLAGGEIAAMALIEAVIRLLPGVLGNGETPREESFEDDLLEYPHYTRPPLWQGRAVPDVLISGHHENVKVWRRQKAEGLTKVRRPDLWAKRDVTKKE